jgi:hypothetical protein
MNNFWTDADKQAPSFEKELHPNCLSCGNHIIHPLCPECIATGYKQWIQKLSNESNEINEINEKLGQFLENLEKFNGKSLTCVSCSEKRTHLCPYCFTGFLHQITKESGAGVRTLSEFLFIFNFDFEHKGYSRELEILGGY